jgi:hypothetical protein
MLALMVMGAVFFTSTLFLSLYLDTQHTARAVADEMLAEQAGNAGLFSAARELRFNHGWKAGYDRARLIHGATYSVSFDPSNPDHSINNLENDASLTASDGRLVPAHSVYLIAVGRCGSGVQRRAGLWSLDTNKKGELTGKPELAFRGRW